MDLEPIMPLRGPTSARAPHTSVAALDAPRPHPLGATAPRKRTATSLYAILKNCGRGRHPPFSAHVSYRPSSWRCRVTSPSEHTAAGAL